LDIQKVIICTIHEKQQQKSIRFIAGTSMSLRDFVCNSVCSLIQCQLKTLIVERSPKSSSLYSVWQLTLRYKGASIEVVCIPHFIKKAFMLIFCSFADKLLFKLFVVWAA
jgi:hypothetical protein